MLDTITGRTVRSFRTDVAIGIREGKLPPVPGWLFNYRQSQRALNWPVGGITEATHETTGLYIRGDENGISSYTVSLPRILYGFNGSQLKSDKDVEAATMAAHSLIGQIAHQAKLRETLTRLDLAINLDYPEPERLVQALWNSPHRSVRRSTERYASGSIRFPGTHLVFQAYWKRPPQRSGGRLKAWHTPKVLRLELQLKRREKIVEYVGEFEGFLPSVKQAYQGLRKYMLGFPACEQISSKCTMVNLLACCEAQGLRMPGGESPMEWHRRSVSRSGHSKMRRAVAKTTNAILKIDWEKLLPEGWIPPSVDVSSDGSTAKVPPLQF